MIAREADWHPDSARDPHQYFYLLSGALAILIVYCLPFILAWSRHDPFPSQMFGDENIYLTRVTDAYRGGNLSNPYLAGHQDAPRFMPELGERTLALLAHGFGLAPLKVVGISRVLVPLLIYLTLWSLARSLGLRPEIALLAALSAPFVPSVSWVDIWEHFFSFQRYSRAVSPGIYVLLLVVALRAVLWTWQKTSWPAAVLAGASIGILFYTPPYYWSFAFLGALWLAIIARHRQRRAMLLSIAVALVTAGPALAGMLRNWGNADVHTTLIRLNLLLPGRTPDLPGSTTRVFLMGIAVLLIVWRRRARGVRLRFLVPFLFTGTFLTLQNVVTNIQMQSIHWIECLIPVWSLALAGVLQGWIETARLRHWAIALSVSLFAAALMNQTGTLFAWEQTVKTSPYFWALDARMPRTLLWLDLHTPANSVVLANLDIMDSLVLFTHNKVYWADYAGQNVVSDEEVQARMQTFERRPGQMERLPFRVDYYLGVGAECRGIQTERLLYQDDSEATCVAF